MTLTTSRRRWLIVVLLVVVTPGLWWRTALPPPNTAQQLSVAEIALPSGCCGLGPLKLEGAWQLDSHNDQFHGYSALVSMLPGQLTAFSDRGYALTLRVDGQAPALVRMQPTISSDAVLKNNRDVEAATFDPLSHRLWLALEGRNAIARYNTDFSTIANFAMPPQLRKWPQNTGPEAMVRLANGHFIILSEDYSPGWHEDRLHPALLFRSEPGIMERALEFRLAGPEGYRPVDMAALPDGRVLILMRRLLWPFPPRFASKLVLADPAAIRAGADWHGIELGKFEEPVPRDNYEGLAVVPNGDGTVTVWVISDDNQAVTQGTYLLRYRLDPRDLPKLP